jgi:hypothetical protein
MRQFSASANRQAVIDGEKLSAEHIGARLNIERLVLRRQ